MNKIYISVFLFLIILFNKVLNINANDDTYINSSNITYNEKENIVELAENSKINFKNKNILIDKGIIDYNKNNFEVFGNFYLYEELTILSGDNLKGNVNLDIFSADNVSYIYNDDLKIDSDNLNREYNIVYFYNNFITPCDLEGYFNCPTWSLRIDKTKYNVEEDKFTHFDTFLQIADYKVFYLPYFSHYGAKAPRKRGFLTPTIEFTVGGNQGIIIPYYLPIKQDTDILFKPKISLNQNFEFIEKYQVETLLNNKKSGGNTSVSVNNIVNENSEDINTTLKIDTRQVISEKSIVTASGLFTNSISTTRSINEEPIKFEDIYLRLENYNFFKKDDYLITELSSVESFDSIDLNSIPIAPSVGYMNFINQNNYSLLNKLDFTILKREESSINNPSESFKLNLNNELTNSYQYNDTYIFNKFILNNSYSEYYFNNLKSSNHISFKSNTSLSTELNYNLVGFTYPKIKLILPLQLKNTNKSINEDSESITFNYQNQFSENRFFGSDLFETSPRIVYGLENNFNYDKKILSLNINQSFQENVNSSYLSKINQNSKFSDFAIESKLINDDYSFKIDTRLDQKELSKKEMNYSLYTKKFVDFSLIYNETQKEAFEDLSNDTQSLAIDISKDLNKNVKIGFNTNLDVKSNYDPYKGSIIISLFDECSKLDISYNNTRFNDNFNTQPTEVISFTFSMDYLGFFGYEQSTNLLFTEPGNIKYGL